MTRVEKLNQVSVPIRGLFNLTMSISEIYSLLGEYWVSVPIRGLFNLTYKTAKNYLFVTMHTGFRPHQGII